MKHSLKIKLTLILAGLMTLLIVVFWIINQSFLDDYYQYSKQKSLSECYDAVNSVLADYDESEWTDEYSDKIEHVEEQAGLSVYLISEGSDDYGPYIKFLYPNNLYMKDARTKRFERVRNALFEYIFAGISGTGKDGKIELLESKNGIYDIYSYRDSTIDSGFIDLVGYLDNGTMVFIRANFDSINESAGISNKFLTFVGIAMIALGALVMYLFSSSFSRPVKAMSSIAKKMSELDFDTKYLGNRKDEIGELGNSINTMSEQLERTISELKSANNELLKDNERKTQIDEMRKEFLSNVSHELKTPIALIQGYAEGLKENINDDPESREFYCDVIIDEALKMNNLVKKLLSLNKLEFGESRIELERFNITALVKSVADSADILAKQKDITINVADSDPIYVWADEFMVEEVVTNYVSNAINHVDGERVVDIRFVKNGNTLRTSVFNTGEPIPEDSIDKVWVKFYKVDKARTREYGGSGIGLSIVKAIMDAHSQKCGVINHENGVEFWFELDCGNGETSDD